MLLEDELVDFVDRCVVHIPATAEIEGGTGFFVARDLVLTCAHVVASRAPEPVGARVALYCDGAGGLAGTVLDAKPWPAVRGPQDRLVPGPDLALIRVDEAGFEHNWITLSAPPRSGFGARLHAFGLSTVYSKTPRLRRRSATFSGFDWDGALISVADCEVPSGSSGGPLFDPEHALIRGVIKASRKPGSEMGGLVVPVDTVRDAFPAYWAECSGEEHAQWRRLREALRWRAVPLETVLQNRERDRIGALCAQRQLGPRDFQKAYAGVRAEHVSCHPGLPDLAYAPHDFYELVSEVAGELNAEFTGCLHPLVGILEQLGARMPADDADYLRRKASHLAAAFGAEQSALLERHRASSAAADAATESRGPVICVRIDEAEPGDGRFYLEAWTYPQRSGRPVLVEERKLALSADEADRRAREIIVGQHDRLPDGYVMVEFAVPRALLNEPLRIWADEALGVGYAVVLRCTDRNDGAHQRWRTRGRNLHPRTAVDAAPADPVEWLSCAEVPPDLWFSAYFGSPERRGSTTVALCHTPSAESHTVLDNCLDVGIPAILWHREGCAEFAHAAAAPAPPALPATAGAEPALCAGARFEAWMSKLIKEKPAGELPEFVRALRGEAVWKSLTRARGLVLLWDDPARVPWANRPPLAEPPRKRVA